MHRMSQGAAKQRLKRVRDEAAVKERRAAVQRRTARDAVTSVAITSDTPTRRHDNGSDGEGGEEVKNNNSVALASAMPSANRTLNDTVTTTTPSFTNDSTVAATCDALLIIGTYHSVMAGLVLRRGKFFIKFSVKHHVGCVNAVAVTPRYIASCGIDERVFLFTNKSAHHTMTNTSKRAATSEASRPGSFNANKVNEVHTGISQATALRLADLGSLTPPTEVTCLAFTPNTAARPGKNSTSSSSGQFLFCGCADGQLLVYRTRDWALVGQLPVHEKAMHGIAVHPTSAGALVVSVGADRSVAVLDMARHKLLTKWKYNTAFTTTTDSSTIERGTAGHKATRSGSSSATAASGVTTKGEGTSEAKTTATTTKKKKTTTKKKMPTADEADTVLVPSSLLPAREEPIGLLFSPSGTYLVVFARFSFVVYTTQTLRPFCVFRYAAPQPSDELHSCVFVSECVMLLGTEAGTLLSCTLPALPTKATEEEGEEEGVPYVVTMTSNETTEEEVHSVAGRYECSKSEVLLRPVELRYPAVVAAEANALRGRPVQVERETRQKHPLRHTARIKALQVHDRTLFSMDSNGVMLACVVHLPCNAAATAGHVSNDATGTSASSSSSTCVLEYVTSVNCQARVTSMDCLAL